MSVVNVNTYHEMAEKHVKSQEWRNYAKRITANPAMKRFVFERDEGVCRFCGRPVHSNWVLHHMDYDHECKSADTVRVAHPTPKRPNRTAKVPDCAACRESGDGMFNECASRLVLVHNSCNATISEIKNGEGHDNLGKRRVLRGEAPGD